MHDQVLTPEELEQVTGTDKPNKQMKILTDNGIFFIKGQKGHFSVTWYAINHPMNLKAANDDEGPNFSALKEGNG